MAALCTKDLFSTMEEARDFINRFVIDKGESYKVICSNQKSHVLTRQSPKGQGSCHFYISASLLKSQEFRIGTMRPHSCNPHTTNLSNCSQHGILYHITELPLTLIEILLLHRSRLMRRSGLAMISAIWQLIELERSYEKR
jgi:hypothetical protein